MTKTAREMVWLQSFLEDTDISSPYPMPMHCNNQVVIFVIGNSTFHERMKHIEIDCHYIWDKVMFKIIFAPHVVSDGI